MSQTLSALCDCLVECNWFAPPLRDSQREGGVCSDGGEGDGSVVGAAVVCLFAAQSVSVLVLNLLRTREHTNTEQTSASSKIVGAI